jgi:replication-associated recombination protein RarA
MTHISHYDPDTGSYELSKNMRDIYDYYGERGLCLSPSVVTRYALSLRTKPLIILSGISGTGKTKIAQLFAEYMLQNAAEEEKEKRLAFVSVRPASSPPWPTTPQANSPRSPIPSRK